MKDKTFDLFYFCGDSWTVANNTDGVLPVPMPEVKQFPYIVSREFNVPYHRTAIGGASNNWIHRSIYEDIPALKKKYNNILAIIGWSDPVRQELYNKKTNRFDTISPAFEGDFCSNYYNYAYSTDWQIYDEQTKVYMKSVRCLFNTLSISWIDAFAFTEWLHVPFLNNGKILKKRFLEICGDEGRIYNPQTKGYGHQNELGNKKIAKEIIKKIRE